MISGPPGTGLFTTHWRPVGGPLAWVARRSGLIATIAALLAACAAQPPPTYAQATSPFVDCPSPANQALVMPPEIVAANGVLTGTIKLTEDFQRVATTTGNCPGGLLRIFQGEGVPAPTPIRPVVRGFTDPFPGPTLRTRLGDLVQLTLINEVNQNRFDQNLDVNECTEVGQGGQTYPVAAGDTLPNCLHASSTANIHFHGTHTSPDATGDNVFLQIRPLPRDNQGNLTTTPAEVTAGLDAFFQRCTSELRNPLSPWPTRWDDLPQDWRAKQEELLRAYQAANPTQPLWTSNEEVIAAGGWPQFYIGAVPYCFALPEYTASTWPPPRGSRSPVMGQSPGTHWYHAHKHGSTAINVMSGMTGAMIIEGKYDDDLNAAYRGYRLSDGAWNTRSQPIMVLNQLGTELNLLGGVTQREFAVNGQSVPTVSMQPGEIQLWRIANTAGRSAAYFMAPENGLQWRQLAQDGVQLANEHYRNSLNKPLFLAPGNRVDLLVQAPLRELESDVLIQNVVARQRLKPTPQNPTAADPNPGTPLMKVSVSGRPVTRYGRPTQMPFLRIAPEQPPFLTDITDRELAESNYRGLRLVFDSKAPRSPEQHTINGVQFDNEKGEANIPVRLGAAEEWTIVNTTASGGPVGTIDHPFHIHINPFQITEFFDPNEYLVDPATGQLLGRLDDTGKTQPISKYVLDEAEIEYPGRQCVLDPDNPKTWGPCRPEVGSNWVWWDVFAIPSGREVTKSDGETETVPGYFKMRSRFVDYPGTYVLHCHILIHEDRGMMFTVDVKRPEALRGRHH